MYVVGLDVGIREARAVICDGMGYVVAQAAEPLTLAGSIELLPPGYAELDPSYWWDAASACLRKVIAQYRDAGLALHEIKALAIDSASGAVVPLDRSGIALRPAFMRNDSRAVREAEECNSVGRELAEKLGYRFEPSFTLPKILWIKRNEPGVFEKTLCFASATDYLVGRLTGNFRVSDTSNAFTAGYDLLSRRWPPFIDAELGIPSDKLPQVVSPGLTVGKISDLASQETGLAQGTPVVAGITEDTAEFLASGAVGVGDYNSAIGTTLELRGVSTSLIKDPLGRVRSLPHPQGYWLPGGASNAGAEFIEKLFPGRSPDELNPYVPQYSPTNMIVYPLVRTGERLPFVNPEAEGFIIGEPRDSRDLYTAYLEGVGFVERWCLELFSELGAEMGEMVYSTGEGGKSPEWMQVRANILNRRVVRPKCEERAIGTAAVAASGTLFSDLESAVRSMIKPGETIEPDPNMIEMYEGFYRAFRDACARRGYG